MVAPPYVADLVGSEPPRRAGLPYWLKQRPTPDIGILCDQIFFGQV